MGYSSLAEYVRISPHKKKGRTHSIDTVTIHCYVGQVTAKDGCDYFATTDRDASSNYVIGFDGSIGVSVDENDRSFCTSSGSNDNRAITIEMACEPKHPYQVTNKAYFALIDLLVDICKRHSIEKLVWSENKNNRVNHINGCNMTVHRDYANKACPGKWLYDRHGEIASMVNNRLNKGDELNMTKAELLKSLTDAECADIVNKARRELRKGKASEFAEAALDWAKDNGLMVGDESGNQMPRDFLTREQFVTVLKRYEEHLNKGA